MSKPKNRKQKLATSSDTTLTDVRSVILDNFDKRVWRATEAALSTHAALHLAGVQKCPGLILEGPSGASKTTVLRFFKEFEHTYRSDDLTPAAFVSHDASQYEEDLEEIDLLPRIQHKTLINSLLHLQYQFAGRRWVASIQATEDKMCQIDVHFADRNVRSMSRFAATDHDLATNRAA